jgi:hypothetical protein
LLSEAAQTSRWFSCLKTRIRSAVGGKVTSASAKSFFGIPIVLFHNALIVLCFAFSPFALAWCYRKMGFNRWVTGLGALLSISSVAGLGSSFESYFNTGVVTQSLGSILVPVFVGSFIHLLETQEGVVRSAVFFSLACISHAAMAIYAFFAGVLIFFFTVEVVDIAKAQVNTRKLRTLEKIRRVAEQGRNGIEVSEEGTILFYSFVIVLKEHLGTA